ncbi:hypothetical protein K491DRAFT_774570 [Lophiostoma macrostomum CBS 122681]|uniref:Uncharacterized protein n=1 Tax=Lophiostoma macrostomum CBS 122681 TaxID=1314788 RepID=A0A6A6TP28_9PLEO|nr:hypothetical protein K491DRAFT_774570 [Lophiostoma macrostomum CBS 122681]
MASDRIDTVYLDKPVIVTFPALEETENAFQVPILSLKDVGVDVKREDSDRVSQANDISDMINANIFHSSYGFFSYPGRHLFNAVEMQERYKLLNSLAASQLLHDQSGHETQSYEERKAAIKAFRKERFAETMRMREELENRPPQNVAQNEDISVRLRICGHCEYYTSVELVFRFNYIDQERLHQPSFECIVSLSEYNMRNEIPGNEERAYAYEPYEREWFEKFQYQDWSEAEYDEGIKLLFRHLLDDDIKCHRIQAIGNPRTLIQLPYNGLHLSQCVNTTDPFYDNFWQVRALRQNIKTAGSIFILTESADTRLAMEKVSGLLIAQSSPGVTPLTQFFEEPRNLQLDLKAMIEPSLGPRFNAPASTTWLKKDRYVVEQAVAALYEHGSPELKDAMYGTCVAIPVPDTYREGMRVHDSFEARLAFNKGYKNQRSLTKGDRFKLVFQKAAEACMYDYWDGRVVDRISIPGKTGVPVVLTRRSWKDFQTGATVYDIREDELLTVTRRELDSMTPDRIFELFQSRDGIHVTVFPSDLENKEVKKILSSQSCLRPPPASEEQPNAELRSRLIDGCELHKGRELNAIPKKVVWATLTPSMRAIAETYAEEKANEVQKTIICDLKDPTKGMPGTLVAMTGCSGGGKTEAACIIAAPYATEVIVSQEFVVYQNCKRQQ